MTRKWFAAFVASLLVLSILAGCTTKQAPAPTPSTPAPAPAPKFKVGMSTDTGGLNDDSFNASAWRGLQKAQTELSAEVKALESKRNEDYEPNFRQMMDLKYDLIWGIGFLMADAIGKSAKENPNQKFAIIDSEVKAPNVASVLFKEEEAAFLMGVIAAQMTKSNKVGFIGGMKIPPVERFQFGFEAGAKSINPKIEVVTVYSGTFTDTAKGKEIALSMFKQGVDLIFPAAGGTGQGAIEAAKEQKKWAIGVDSDQNHLAPEQVLSSAMKGVDVAVFEISKQAKEGKFPGGKTSVLGLKEGAVGYSPKTLWNKMPDGTKALVDKWADAVKTGKLVVPNTEALLKSYQAPKL